MPELTSSSLFSRCQFVWQQAVDSPSRYLLISWLMGFSLAIRISWLRRRLQASQKAHLIRIQHHGQIVPLYLRGQDVPILVELFQDETYRLPETVRADLKEDALIVDIGAHIGLATRYFEAQGIRGTWVAVEPSPGNVAVLQQNLHALPNTQLIPQGIGNPDTTYQLTEDTFSYNHRLRAVGDPTGSALATISLEELLTPFDRVDLLKIDIEGAEREALRNAYLWRQQVQYLLIELHAPYTLTELQRDLAIEDSQILTQRNATVLIQLQA